MASTKRFAQQNNLVLVLPSSLATRGFVASEDSVCRGAGLETMAFVNELIVTAPADCFNDCWWHLSRRPSLQHRLATGFWHAQTLCQAARWQFDRREVLSACRL